MTQTENKQTRPFWLMLSLSFIIITFGIITIASPSLFWKFMDIILGIFLMMTGISAIVNTVKNQNVKYIRFLLVLGVLITILGLLLIFSWSQFIGTLTIWLFALWAIIRGIILIFFGATNKENQNFRWAILGLGALLFILGLVIMFSDKSEARSLAGICIGISTIFDGILLLFFSFRVKDNPSLQEEILNQSDQNEIAQGNVVISETTVTVSVPTEQSPSVAQPTTEAQPATETQPVVSIPAPQNTNTTEVQPGDIQQPTVENPAPSESQSPQS